MCLLCWLLVDENHNFWQIVILGALVVPAPFIDEGQIWCAKAEPTSTLTSQISSECVHCVGFWRPKSEKFWQILNFGGLLYRRPFTYEG